MARVVQPCTFYPHPTEEESQRNPTQTIQYEYQRFLQNYKTQLRHQYSAYPPSEFKQLMDSSSGDCCSRTFFYFSLRAINAFERPESIQRIARCAQNGVNGFPNAVNPVDAAIRCYSILLSNLYASERSELADVVVCDFLREDYCVYKREDLQEFYKRKNKVLYLILSDIHAYAAAPDGIKTEILVELRDGIFLRSVLSMKHPNHPGVLQANVIITTNGLGPPIEYSSKNVADAVTYISRIQFATAQGREFAQFSGGRKRKLKPRSRSSRLSRSSRSS